MKRKMFKALAVSRRWANTERGETTIVATLTVSSALFIIALVLCISSVLTPFLNSIIWGM